VAQDTSKGDGNEDPSIEDVDDSEDSTEEVSREGESQGRGHSKKKDHGGESTFVRVKLPYRKKGEMFAIAEQLMGGSRLKIICEDGKSRLARIPGKMKKRRWIRTGDLLIIKPWEFQDEKADVVRRYTKTESSNLSRRGVIPDNINVF
jgi:translation initiation factor 1A